MSPSNRTRAAAAIAALTASPMALAADAGGISSSGWWSMLGIAAVFGVLVVVYRKLN